MISAGLQKHWRPFAMALVASSAFFSAHVATAAGPAATPPGVDP